MYQKLKTRVTKLELLINIYLFSYVRINILCYLNRKVEVNETENTLMHEKYVLEKTFSIIIESSHIYF